MESDQVATLKLKVTDMEEEDVALRSMEVTCFSDFLELLSWKSKMADRMWVTLPWKSKMVDEKWAINEVSCH